jgi:lysophospholipase L1-like esterase
LAAVDRLRQACDELGVRLAILTPLPAPETLWIDRFGRRLAKQLGDRMAPYPVPLCRVEREMIHEARALFMRDGIHMNPAGHAAVADALSATLVRWVRSAA